MNTAPIPIGRRTMLRFVAGAAACGTVAETAFATNEPCIDRRAWVAQSLRRLLTIGPGMTRNELMRIVTTEGGLSSAHQRTFVSRDCPYFKVDVQFRRINTSDDLDPRARSVEELGSDVITSISRPYLAFSVMD